MGRFHGSLIICEYNYRMFRYSLLFRSRWLALLWSIGIIWSAVSYVGYEGPDEDVAANGAAPDEANLNQLQALVGKLQAS